MRIVIPFAAGAIALTVAAYFGILPANESLCGLIGIGVGAACLVVGFLWQEKSEAAQ